jgi:peptidoglycan hydrolase-like protein with peptidoglycan-binding domain
MCCLIVGMRILQEGLTGDDVVAWQKYLVTQGYSLTVDGNFGPASKAATATFQQKYGLVPDGSVGPNTMGTAMQHGFGTHVQPVKPVIVVPSGIVSPFKWVAAPTANDADHIQILDNWIATNITTVWCPALNQHLTLNHSCVDDVLAWLTELATTKRPDGTSLLHILGPFNGSFNPRYKRGMPHDQNAAHLSNHSAGFALDFNAAHFPLGTPALSTDPVHDIVPIAKRYNINFGGDFVHRPDPMHWQSVHSPFP